MLRSLRRYRVDEGEAGPPSRGGRHSLLLALCALLGACDEPAARPPAQPPTVAAKPPPRELSTVDLARQTLPSVVAIQTADGSGSGFFVAPDLVATCFHVVRGNGDIRLKAVGWSGRATSVAAWDEENDLAVLRVAPSAAGRGLRIDRGPYVVGSKVVVVSSPLGLDDTVSDGLISALRSDPVDRLQFTAPISPGSSGGPIVNVRGEVTGMVASFRAQIDRGVTIGQNLNFAVPASLIMVAMATPNDTSLQAFARQTIPPEEKRWRDVQASLDQLDRELPDQLGPKVGRAYAAAVRRAVENRDAKAVTTLLERAKVLEKDYKEWLEIAGTLANTDDEGALLARELLTAWEDNSINASADTKARLDGARARGQSHLQAKLRELSAATFPDAFAGFPFKASIADVSKFCFPGYVVDATPGLSPMRCPRSPVAPPFASGEAILEFLNGALVTVHMTPTSYQNAVRDVAAKYGAPSFSIFRNGQWQRAEQPSFGPDTSFNWMLNGGRIRIGRLGAKPFVMFTHVDRDRAVDNSF
jgi:hypothetical protein